jgi:hypothetical protein
VASANYMIRGGGGKVPLSSMPLFTEVPRRGLLGNSERGGHEKGRGMVVPALLQRSLVALQEKRY